MLYAHIFYLNSAHNNRHLAERADFPDHCCKAKCIIHVFLRHCSLFGAFDTCIHSVINYESQIQVFLHIIPNMSGLLLFAFSSKCRAGINDEIKLLLESHIINTL